MAMYDASYRPGVILRDDGMNAARATFLEQNEASYEEESSLHQFGSDDDVSEIGPSDVEYSPNASRGVLQNFGLGAIGVTSSVLQVGARLFYQQRQCVQMGEGPTLLRLLCFLGGLVMLTSSIISVVNVFALLTAPSTYVLQMYQGFFGVITMIVEAKDWDCFDQFKPWMTEWFRFLTVPAGKGAFYLFVGSLGVSLWVRNLLSFTVGLYMAFMGVVCIAVHAGTSWKPPLEHDDRMIYGDVVNSALHDAFNESVESGRYEDDAEIRNNNRRDTTSTSTSGYNTGGRSGKIDNSKRSQQQRYHNSNP